MGADRSITAVDLTRLLARLDPDRERAALEYERLRHALVKFFDWRGAPAPDECADVTLDRLARKIGQTDISDLHHYAHGIAKLVLLERRRQPAFSSIDAVVDSLSVEAAPSSGAEDRLHNCFEGCLARFPDESRSLIVGYYEGERTEKISNRRRLAAALGLSENALRSRVQRLRDRLEQCVQRCVAGRSEEAP
jgi:DNA-directed RNA polymerase specialized sigma24 family protein